jgi:hypothetical protein
MHSASCAVHVSRPVSQFRGLDDAFWGVRHSMSVAEASCVSRLVHLFRKTTIALYTACVRTGASSRPEV